MTGDLKAESRGNSIALRVGLLREAFYPSTMYGMVVQILPYTLILVCGTVSSGRGLISGFPLLALRSDSLYLQSPSRILASGGNIQNGYQSLVVVK